MGSASTGLPRLRRAPSHSSRRLALEVAVVAHPLSQGHRSVGLRGTRPAVHRRRWQLRGLFPGSTRRPVVFGPARRLLTFVSRPARPGDRSLRCRSGAGVRTQPEDSVLAPSSPGIRPSCTPLFRLRKQASVVKTSCARPLPERCRGTAPSGGGCHATPSFRPRGFAPPRRLPPLAGPGRVAARYRIWGSPGFPGSVRRPDPARTP